MSIPWLVPHTGVLALVGIVPLLCAERIAGFEGTKRFFLYYFSAFLFWNVLTTYWVCNATLAGGIFACVVNALQMAVIFAAFRYSKKRLQGVLPYIFLVVAWIAWERFYLTSAQISWPWLTLGYAFAGSTRLVQWYEFTGSLGGSLWIWISNLAVFGFMTVLSEGMWGFWTMRKKVAACSSAALALFAPVILSIALYHNCDCRSDKELDVVIAQPDFDPYQKFESMDQDQQNAVLTNLFAQYPDNVDLYIAPETFTSDVMLNDVELSPTVCCLRAFLESAPSSSILFGASTYELFQQRSAPSILSRPYMDGWVETHNSAIMLDTTNRTGIYHKSKLVVGTELTPYPKLFVPLDDFLSRIFGVNGLMSRCIGQGSASALTLRDGTKLGCAVCYESVYGEFCTGYVNDGASIMAVITNDAWWGNTPGYKQHFSYSRLRAIELRRDIARCANTGISGIIDRRGDVVCSTSWWKRDVIKCKVGLDGRKTFFVRYGDITGRVCVLIFLLLLLLLFVRTVSKSR